MSYSGVVTMLLEHATLTQVDEETRRELEAVADAYEQAPVRLRAAILAAARNGDKPAAIVRAIRHAYTYEYVARLIRSDRADNPELYRARQS
jgi:hypothetical protein